MQSAYSTTPADKAIPKRKVNVIVRLKFELVYYDVALQHVGHYATETL